MSRMPMLRKHVSRKRVSAIRYSLLALAALAAFSICGSPSAAQTWPQRTVKFILPVGAGAGADITGRLFAERLTVRWGRPVVVENRPGGDGFLAINAMIGAADDHVLLLSPASIFTAHRYVHDKLPYDPRDLVPIARITNTVIVIAVPTALNVGSLAELVTKARGEPGKLNWASMTGANTLLFDGFLNSEKLVMTRVPYKDPVLALTDVAEGRVQAYVAALAIVRSQVQAGKVRILALTNSAPASFAPGIPTAAAAGFPALTFDGLVGWLGPRGMALELRERIAADIREIAADPAITERLNALGQVVSPGTPAEFAAAIEQQYVTVARIGAALGIKPAQ